MASPSIGFIGLGIMGSPMALRIQQAGHPLTVFTRTRAKARPVLEAGAAWADSPAQVADRAEILFTMVTDAPDVEAALFAPDGAAERLQRGACVVDLSTISPEGARRIQAQLAAREIAFLDAPVTGGEVGARSGSLTIMAGGRREDFSRVRPILELMGKKVIHVGPSGAGQALKACNQILCAVNMIAVCEALSLARGSGLDLNVALDTLAGGAGGSWAWTNLGRRILDGDLEPAFMVKLMQKDLRIVQEQAQLAGAPLPGAALAQQLFRAVEAAGGAERGTQAMITVYERLMNPAG